MANKALCSTTCPYCGVGCGIDVQRTSNENTSAITAQLSHLEGRRDHPANFGRLCVKGSHLLDTLSLDNRLLKPRINNKSADWASAITRVADGFSKAIEEFGSDSVAFYVSGQLLTEDYYVANKLMKGYIGSANIDTNSRLCMSSAVAAYKRAFGADAVPCCYQDLESTEYLVITGSNAAWTHPVLFQRIAQAKQRNPNMRIIVIDPRRTQTCEIADQHLALKPGSDAALFIGLFNYLVTHDHLDTGYIEQYTEGFETTFERAHLYTLDYVATYCDITQSELTQFYQGFAKSKSAVTFYSMGINQSTSGVDKANAIINCHLSTGKIGREGCGPFSITGQPNAMGGREVGGLANMLAAHMDIENAYHQDIVQTYWQSPTIPKYSGHKAVDLFDAIEQGRIKAVWIMATNPLVSMPNRNKIESALEKCPFVVVSDVVSNNDTLGYADIVLPATAWSEKDGTVTNSERTISRQRGLLPPSGEARHDWQIICDVAQAMGFNQGFNFEHPAEIFAEHAGLSAYQNNGSRDFDLSGLCGLTRQQYDDFKPIQWPVTERSKAGTARLFTDGKFFTSSGRAKFIAVEAKQPEQQVSTAYPWVLNTGRIRDQWHTMTRTALSTQLNQHISEPFLALHPDDAKSQMIQPGQLVELTSVQTQMLGQTKPVVLRIEYDKGMRQGHCFAPIHWSQENTSGASITRLFSSANDPISGQPELKHAAVAIKPLDYKSYGQLFCKAALPKHFLDGLSYWSVTTFENGHHYSVATSATLVDFNESIRSLLNPNSEIRQRILAGSQQLSVLSQHQLEFAVFTYDAQLSFDKGEYEFVSQEWVSQLLSSPLIDAETSASLLRIIPSEEFTLGKLVCSCFNVRQKSIESAVDDGCSSVDALGRALKCGTNCGSCKTELEGIIKERKQTEHRSLQSIPITQLAPSSEAISS